MFHVQHKQPEMVKISVYDCTRDRQTTKLVTREHYEQLVKLGIIEAKQ